MFVTPVYASNTYDAVNNSCVGSDHEVYDVSGRNVVSCIPHNDWLERSTAVQDLKESLMTIFKGSRILLKNGFTDYCPSWYMMDCVIPEKEFQRYL